MNLKFVPAQNGFPGYNSGEIYGFTCSVFLDYVEEFDAVLAWCTERFGDEDSGPNGSWFERYSTIWFRDKTHAMEFKMRWV
ncbi:MAG: hypothetical protein EOP84_08020 [Verrucomicrobiaceae bacterium]|nr:MAG: hypothetical protein EOP84_08020 [Verrucomicrobiaceae bacterium]